MMVSTMDLITVKLKLMKELFMPKIEGHFKVEFIKEGIKKKIYEQKNTILPAAIEIMTGRLAGLGMSALDYIQIYNTSTLISAKLIQSTTKISANEVEFFTIFDEIDFNGDFDEARLISSPFGAFAGVTGLVQNKPADEKLAITWKIKLV